MNRPMDPAKHGKAPQKKHSRTNTIYLKNDKSDLSIDDINKAWSKALIYLANNNGRLVNGPYIKNDWGHVVIYYTYEWDNIYYPTEQAEWENAIFQYKQNIIAWEEFEKEKAKNKKIGADIDQRIAQAEQRVVRSASRLANLKAVKAGLPIPFPDA
jgi:hypothetical protein